MSETNGTSAPDWGDMFEDFHKRHKDPSGRKLKFTAYFNSALEAMIDDKQLSVEARGIAWLARYAWGNNSDCAVDKPGGRPLRQQDFADRAGFNKQRASEVFEEIRAHGYLLDGKGHLLYPNDQPTGFDKSNQNDQKSRPLPDFDSPFLRWCSDEWKVRSLADFQELESAEAKVRAIKIVRLGQWRKWKRARTSGDGILNGFNSSNSLNSSGPHHPPVFQTVGLPQAKAEEEEVRPSSIEASRYARFKAAYPEKQFDEAKAKPFFQCMDVEEQDLALKRLPLFIACDLWKQRPRYIPLASNFIKERKYAFAVPELLHVGAADGEAMSRKEQESRASFQRINQMAKQMEKPS